MEPIISKLQEGVKYPRFERDATTIINDLVEHITKERGVYSSSIEPNPNEHKVWFNTNNNTLNIYENGRWNTISGQGGSGGSIPSILNGIYGINMINGTISGVQTLNISPNGSIGLQGAAINGGNIEGATINGATISGATISGGNIGVNKIKAKSIETPLINLISGDTEKSIQLLGDNYIFHGKLADSTLFHSIDLGSGSIAGLTSIKTLSYTGLTIEPYDTTSTGTPITIHGRAAGLSLGANSTAPFTLDGISSLNWKNGSSNGYMMKFNTNNNTINSNYDTFNIANGTISGSANINLTLSGTISGATISGATIDDAFITGNTTINGATISGATMSGGNIYGATIGNATIGTGSALLYAGSKILVTYTGSVDNPILMPNGGNIGYQDASLKICGVTLTGGDFTKLKNLQ